MAPIKKDVEQEGGRSPRKQEMRTLQLAQNWPTVHLKTLSSSDMSTRTRRAEAHDHTDNSSRDALFLDGTRDLSTQPLRCRVSSPKKHAAASINNTIRHICFGTWSCNVATRPALSEL